MELKIIYEHEEMRDMVVHVNSDGMQKIMQILMDDNNIIVTQLTKRAADGGESAEIDVNPYQSYKRYKNGVR
jgi:hypothetical protein